MLVALLPGRRAALCRLKHPLAKAASLKELDEAEWITTSITAKAENEISDLFELHGLPQPRLALRSQSALTLLTCLANADLLAMAPAYWTQSTLADRILTTINVKEALSAPTIIVVTKSDVPLAPAAEYLLDLVKRMAVHLGARATPQPRPESGAPRWAVTRCSGPQSSTAVLGSPVPQLDSTRSISRLTISRGRDSYAHPRRKTRPAWRNLADIVTIYRRDASFGRSRASQAPAHPKETKDTKPHKKAVTGRRP